MNKHIDLSYIVSLSNGSNEFVNSMITLFMKQTPILLESIENSFANNDMNTLSAIVHKMKPSISFMGIKELESVIRGLEEGLEKKKKKEELKNAIQTIINISRIAIIELEEEKKLFS